MSQITNFTSDIFAVLKGLKNTVVFVTDSVSSVENLWILSFVILIFIMLKILVVSGGFNGLIRLTIKYVKNKRAAQLLTAFLGVAFFIDDYANAIIIGSAMRPLTDRFKISREKLAFIVDATSAPVTGLAVISTWIATEVSLFEGVGSELGINKSGYSMFFDAIQFRFYCFLMLIFIFIQILMKVDFGPMRTAELKANSGNNADDPTGEENANGPSPQSKRMGKAASAIIPIVGLLVFHLTALWISGDGPAKLSAGLSPAGLSYWRQTISDVDNSSQILAMSSSFGIILSVITALFIEKMRIKILAKAAFDSLKTSYLPFSILILAWSLKNCCDLLGTGKFLTSVLADNIPPLIFPAIVFLVASITSFATGTSWGTMAILIPTAIPVAFALDGNSYGLTTMISLGAVLDGAIFGDHCSPVSDTTIISSIATRCDLMKHVNTQLPYGLLIAGLAFVCGYLPAALGFGWLFIIISAIIVIIITLYVISLVQKRLQPKRSIS